MTRSKLLRSALLIAVALAWNVCGAQALDAEIIFGSGYEDSNIVEWIQRHGAELDGKSVFIDNVYVTASLNPNQSMFVQESADVSGPAFPQFDGIRLYNPGFAFTLGSCIEVLGNVSNFQGSVQISPITEIASYGETGNCGTPIAAHDVNLDDIATDVDMSTSGDQPGAMAAMYNGALVRVSSITATTSGVSGDFRVAKTASPAATLVINKQFYQYPASVGETFTSITGVLDFKNDQYYLSPRSADDIVP